MNQEIKERWIAELESGKWEQTNGFLALDDTNKRCCLGVLCDIAVEDGIVQRDVTRDSFGVAKTVVYRGFEKDSVGTTAVLPEEVMVWADIDSDNGSYDTSETKNSKRPRSEALSQDNDLGKSFQDIANIIREKF